MKKQHQKDLFTLWVRTLLITMLFIFFSPGGQNLALGQENQSCLRCHGKKGLSIRKEGRKVSLYVNARGYSHSVHGDFDCVDCHDQLQGVNKYPHRSDLKRVNCSECHDSGRAISAYWKSTHGQLVKSGDPDSPRCQDCHGDHEILPLDDPHSAISPFNLPQMCAQCHEEGAKVERTHDIPQEQILKRYKQSIHGEGLFKQGLIVTAVCTSCHTGHNVLPHTDPKSSIHQDNVVNTCMKCHGLIEEVHRKVIGGELWESEGVVPLCVDCHSPHEVRKVFYDTKMSNADCMGCHEKKEIKAGSDGRSLFVDLQEHGISIHGRKGVTCAQCHSGVTPSKDRACETLTEKVNCAVCHESEVKNYQQGIHGRLHAASDPNAPTCNDCHGQHKILEHEITEGLDPELETLIRTSSTFGRNVPELCGRCHKEGGQAAVRNLGSEENILEHYRMSIHGKGLLESGLVVTATCTNCHSPHMELPKEDPLSTVNEENIAVTCGKCHDGIYEQYRDSIHSPIGNPDYQQKRIPGQAEMHALPRCNDCHSSHSVGRTDLPDFKLGIMQQCGKCHEDVTESYFETYHGKASALGDTSRAKCFDCHGAHHILSPDDPNSPLSKDNIVQTCGNCHEGSHQRFTSYLTHANHHDRHKYPALFYTFWAMTLLLVGTFGFFGLHTLAWIPRSWKLRKQLKAELDAIKPEGKTFVRFSAFHRKTHLVVILSFFGLVITGMMLKFSYMGWAEVLSNLMGGMHVAGWIHRVCAVATFGYFGVHIWFLCQRFRKSKTTIRQFLLGPNSMVPNWTDVQEFVQTVKWFIGKGPRPHYGKWTYWEKFDYFAVFWGVAIIGITGLMLWFPVFFTHFLPGWMINIATIIHSDEALLATGFIFTIHFFNTHFRPEKFPMDPIIFTGRMTLKELKHDKPRWYEELVANGELEKYLGDPPSPRFGRLVRIFGFSALAVGIILIILIIYALLFA